jgi:4-amino-4-deoxy-L-arabinose transferase-like glycosyltransferase
LPLEPSDSPLQSPLVRDIVILCVTCAALLLPFLGKPAHIDDPMYIWTAQQITAHPLDFYGFSVNWNGHLEPVPVFMMNPPLLPYYLAAASKLVGWSEFALHAAILPLSVLSVVGFYLLACGFCRYPLSAALMMLFCPAFLVSSTNLMCEAPMLCLWLWTIVFWVRGSARSIGWLPLSGLLAGAAVLTKYSAVCVIPLLAAHAIMFRSTRRVWIGQILSLLIPLAMILAYNHYTAVMYGRGMFLNAVGFSSDSSRGQGIALPARIMNALLFVGGGAIAGVLAGFVALDARTRVLVVAVVPLAILAARKCFSLPGGWDSPWPFYSQAGVLTAAGLVIFITCIREMIRTKADGLFLLLWTGGVFVFAAKLNWAINARSILPLIPPLCILVQRALERQQFRLTRPYLAAMSLGAVLSVLTALVDHQSADANRVAAAQMMKHRTDQKVWFTGHWGFQYYMQQLGAIPLDTVAPACRPGDIVIVPLNNYGSPMKGVPLKAINTFSEQASPFLSLVNGSLGGDFYFSPGDRLPFVFGPIPPESFVIFRVMPSRQ